MFCEDAHASSRIRESTDVTDVSTDVFELEHESGNHAPQRVRRDLDATATMAPPALTLLRKYAQLPNPTTLPPDLYFSHTQTSLTIFDCYPKSIFHFLILPRVQPDLPAKTLSTLRTLLKGDRARAKSVLEDLRNEAESLKATIEEEMMSKYGFKWGIWTGFHAVQSME